MPSSHREEIEHWTDRGIPLKLASLLVNHGIRSVDQIWEMKRSNLLLIPSMGHKSVDIIASVLHMDHLFRQNSVYSLVIEIPKDRLNEIKTLLRSAGVTVR